MTPASLPNRDELGQFFTPAWASEALLEHYFSDLGLWDRVLEPSCGPGSFLAAVPDHVQAMGVEIDPALAEIARRTTGRPVITGDFTQVEIDFKPTIVVGNPPYKQAMIQAFIDRAWSLLPDEGRCGFLLPVYAFQTPSVVERLSERWHIRQDLVPRTLFPRLKLPLCFALLTKGRRGLVGFTLYSETFAISKLRRRFRALLASGEASAWSAVVRAALELRGGRASLQELYAEIEGEQPTSNPFWKEKVRQTVQRIAVRVERGVWALPQAEAVAA